MTIQNNISLKSYNTFGLDVKCRIFAEARSNKDLLSLKEHPEFEGADWFVLGGGSNILLTDEVKKPVLKVSIPGVRVYPGPGSDVVVKVGAGVVWHEFVMWSLENRIYGLENLSLIPGQVGAAPMQNIGAYGVELKDVFETLEAYSVTNGNTITMDAYDCAFGYRTSTFKKHDKNKFVITSVSLRLSKTPKLQLDYGDVRHVLNEMGVLKPTPLEVSKAVMHIRKSKLPDPEILGNAGSFFKNPVVTDLTFQELRSKYPDMPGYPTDGNRVKIPAGWLIDRLGLKGFRKGDAGVHDKQALVLVNHGNATGIDILNLANDIRVMVSNTYGITLDPEVNII